MGGIVRASVDTVWLVVIGAEIAGRRFGCYLGDFLARTRRIINGHLNGLHVDVAVRAIIGTEAAADAPVLNGDFQAVAATNRANRASDHAQGIFTLPAGGSHEVVIETQTVSDQATDPIMGVCAGTNTLIATGAFVQIQH